MNDDAELNRFFEDLVSPPPQRPEGEDFFVLTVPLADGGDPDWRACCTVIGTWETLCRQFNLTQLPPGACLRQGEPARRHLRKAAREEARYQSERRLKRRAGGKN